MLKRLKWPSEKYLAFYLICVIITFGLAGGPRTDLIAFLDQHIVLEFFTARHFGSFLNLLYLFGMVYFAVAFIGLIFLGWYASLWRLSLAALLFHIVVQAFGYVLDPRGFLSVDSRGCIPMAGLVFILVLRGIPRQIEEKTQWFTVGDPDAELPRPGYKLSSFMKFIWVVFWGIAFLIYFVAFVSALNDLYRFSAYSDLFTLQRNLAFAPNDTFLESLLVVDLFGMLVWGAISTFLLLDAFREDARFFIAGVGIFAFWQFVKLIAFYFSSYPLPGYTGEVALVFMLLSISLLLRAAWNRPSQEAA
ncbi:MAG: hypothetical protein HND51_16235 [Chloroflexi bacterium]|nr:hypothetical protein [Chloroflexota bacterium]